MGRSRAVERKRGNRLGFWFFRTAVSLFGLGGAYGFLYFVGLYYLVVDRGLVKATLAYVRRRFPDHGPLRRLLDVYLLFVSQGKNLIDRYALAAGYSDISLDIKGFDELKRLYSAGSKGFILLTAHVGNWQAAMMALHGIGRPVHLMMRPEDNQAVKQTLNIDGGGEKVKVIFTDDSLAGAIQAVKVLEQGDLVAIMGDRVYGFSSAEATFLGDQVCFPHGAFTLAAAVQCPVVVLLSAKVGTKKYVVDVSHVIPPPAGGRRRKDAAMGEALQQFADVLEQFVREYPYQWFVFRDIWTSNE
jgi:predicted LPLAT superfamily acyltransferase